jgi:hypothetical protein
MNKLHEAVYIGSRNFCRQHPDIFVFSEFDSGREQVILTIEYNGGFAIARELKDQKTPYTFGPRVKKFADYSLILRSNKPHYMVHTILSGMYDDMCKAYDLTFMDAWKNRLGSV